MRNSRLILLACLASGCSRAFRQEAVFVDLSQIPRLQPIQVPPSPALKQAPNPPMEVDMFALPPASLHVVGGKQESEIAGLIAQNERKALRQLEEKLVDVYQAELDRAFAEEQAQLEPKEAERRAVMLAERLKLLNQYAKERGPKLARLTLIMGFPDPDPATKAPSPKRPVPKQLFEEARQLREEIAKLDGEFDQRLRQTQEVQSAQAEKEFLAVQLRYAEARAKAQERAHKEALEQLKTLDRAIATQLNGERNYSFKGLASERVRFQPPETKVKALKLEAKSAWDEDARLRNEVAHWRAVKGYLEAKDRSQGRDGTKEFLAWRSHPLPGPSASLPNN